MGAVVRKSMAVAVLAGMVTLALATAPQNERVELLFKAAVHKETIDGDLKGAIEQYRKVLARAGANRPDPIPNGCGRRRCGDGSRGGVTPERPRTR